MLLIIVLIAILCIFLCYTSREQTFSFYGMGDDDDSGDDYDEDDRSFIALGMDEDLHERILKVDEDTFKAIKGKEYDARAGSIDKFDKLKKISYYTGMDKDNLVSFKVSHFKHYATYDEFMDGTFKDEWKKFFPHTKKKSEAVEAFTKFYTPEKIEKLRGVTEFKLESF
jgi:ASC-1-like (ASCH) protein